MAYITKLQTGAGFFRVVDQIEREDDGCNIVVDNSHFCGGNGP